MRPTARAGLEGKNIDPPAQSSASTRLQQYASLLDTCPRSIRTAKPVGPVIGYVQRRRACYKVITNPTRPLATTTELLLSGRRIKRKHKSSLPLPGQGTGLQHVPSLPLPPPIGLGHFSCPLCTEGTGHKKRTKKFIQRYLVVVDSLLPTSTHLHNQCPTSRLASVIIQKDSHLRPTTLRSPFPLIFGFRHSLDSIATISTTRSPLLFDRSFDSVISLRWISREVQPLRTF
ncbi:hypothetical protein F5Y17DRAFT_266646 [Xylariaceae sp. FL0594]|nr:hypothetical protein F5Y17DRAFT_266646 [Xylariaceae sp. FL0594]